MFHIPVISGYKMVALLKPKGIGSEVIIIITLLLELLFKRNGNISIRDVALIKVNISRE